MVAVNVIGLLRTLEQITRRPRRGADGEDGEPLAVSPDGYYGYAKPDLGPYTHREYFADGAEQLAEREAEEEVSEPAPVVCLSDGGRCECDRTSQGCIAYHTTETKLADLKADRGTGAINDGEPQLVTLSGREYERYLDGALNEPFVHVAEVCRAHQAEECWVCDDENDDLWVHPRDLDAEPDDADAPNPAEPGLTSDELVGVRELLERFGLADVPAAPSPAGTGSPADDGHPPVPPAGEPSRYDELGGGPW